MENQRGSVTESARGLTERLRTDGREQVESRKRMAADQIDEVAHALSRASEQLEHQPTLASYTSQIASSVGNLATRLRDGSIEELIDDTRQLARRNPGLFILGSFAAGVALARFLKASQRSAESSQYAGDESHTGEAGYSSEFSQASASQPDYPSGSYSPSAGATEQPYTNPQTGG